MNRKSEIPIGSGKGFPTDNPIGGEYLRFTGRKSSKPSDKYRFLELWIGRISDSMKDLYKDVSGISENMTDDQYQEFKKKFMDIANDVLNVDNALRHNSALPVIKKKLDKQDEDIRKKAMSLKKLNVGTKGIGVGLEF